jgi:ABC-type branched-subunit amino acid transport system substrate-binding protein
MPVNTGIFTKNPASLPNIAWQTPGERQVLSRQSTALTQSQIQSQPAAPIVKLKLKRKAKIALLLPLTGKNADLGQAMLKAAQMALFDVGSSNAELVPHDTRSTKEGAAAAAQESVAAGTDIILGPIFADDLKAVRPVVAASGTPVVSFTTDWNQGGGNTYIMGFLPFAQVARVAQYAQSRGLNKLAVYAPQTEYGNVVLSTLQKTGANIVRAERYSPQQSDLSALVKDFAETSKAPDGGFKFDSLMLPLGGEGLHTLVSLLGVEGVSAQKVKFLGTGLWDDAALASYPGLYGSWYAAPDPKLRADFEKRYQGNYGASPPRLASLAYDAMALAAVLARSGDGAASPYTRENLTNPRGFAGIDGIFRFRPDGFAERGLAILEIQSGKPRMIDPAPTAFISSGS